MKRVKKKWLVELTRYNFGQPYSVVGKTFDSNPTRHEVQQYLDEVNSKDPDKDFRTTLEVKEFYDVENIEVREVMTLSDYIENVSGDGLSGLEEVLAKTGEHFSLFTAEEWRDLIKEHEGKLKNLEVVKIDFDYLIFNNGMKLYSIHDPDCCENHYLSLEDLTIEDFEGLRFDLTTDNFFERIEDYGIALLPTNGHPIRIPGYGYNNGYYSDNLSLVVTKPNSEEIYKSFDVTECQKWVDDSSY